MKLSGVVLAGGASRRMGRDKAWVEVDGQPLIIRAVDMLRELGVAEVFISGRAGTDYSDLACPVLLDLEPGGGPLGGIERALWAANSGLVLVVAVDLARMKPEFLAQLIAHCDSLTGVVPSLKGELEPLAAIYPKRCHELVRACLRRGEHAARDFAEACLRERAVRRFAVREKSAVYFENWNSPGETRALKISRRGALPRRQADQRRGAKNLNTKPSR
jgi:molybdopterin-guanine dinucleotide biosynthesis protein A